MKKMILNLNSISVEKAFDEFQRFNYSKNLRGDTIDYYDDCFKYFR